MQCKVLTIRFGGEEQAHDEAAVNDFLAGVEVKQVTAAQLVGENVWSVLLFYEDSPSGAGERRARSTSTGSDDIQLEPAEEALYEVLKQWRARRAADQGLAAYVIANNDCLKQVVRARPRTKADLLQIKGFGERRVQQYGDELLAVLAEAGACA